MSDETKLSVQEAIAEVMRRLPAIGKDEKAPPAMGGFQYRGIEAMTKVIQPIMADVGLVIVPNAKLVEIRPAPGQKEAWQDTILEVYWTIVGPDGTDLPARTVGIGRDQTDKGCTKAQTQAYKYLLLHLFCISDADDDADGHDYSGAQQQDEPEVDPAQTTFGRIKTWGQRDKEGVGQALLALAEMAGRKLTPKDLREHPDFHDAIVDALDGFDATAAQEAHTGPQVPDNQERQVQ